MDRLIFATKNQGKMKEIRLLLGGLHFSVLSMQEAGLDLDIVEDGTTFEENARIKAEAVRDASGALSLADDSGLEIDYLNGAPGVYSARYLGEETPYDVKNGRILERLAEVPDEKRTARFVSVICAAFPDGRLLSVRGVVEGRIAHEIRGTGGFGYDPIFYVPEYKMTTAEMPLELKNQISHRGKALSEMKQRLLAAISEEAAKLS